MTFFERPPWSLRLEGGYPLLLVFAVACAAPRSPGERTPREASPSLPAPIPSAAPGQPLAVPSPPRVVERSLLPPADKRPPAPLPAALAPMSGLRPAPRICGKTARGLARANVSCGTRELAIEALSRALTHDDPVARDAALFALESCASFPAGLVRALRADSFRACADQLVTPFFSAFKQPVAADVADALIGLQLAARLERVAQPPPAYGGNGSVQAIAAYIERVVRPWLEARFDALATLERATAQLAPGGYGDTIVSVALSLAAGQSYVQVRGVALPNSVKTDYQSRQRFYGSLDAELGELKAKRDALLLRAAERLSLQGIHRGSDADRWYSFFKGQSLPLRLEAPPPVVASSASERLVARVPAFYAERLLGERLLDDPRLFRLLAESGIPPESRRALEQRTLSATDAEVLAYFHGALAQRSGQSAHWGEAVRWLEAANQRLPSAELLLATARSAPRRAAHSEQSPGPVVQLTPLETYAETRAPARLRTFALSNAAVFASVENTTAALERATQLLAKAHAIAPDPAAERCLESGRFFRRDTPCELADLP